jgi:hypothetical protein
MKKNKCIRCDKTERFGCVFESIKYNDSEFHLCVECAQLLYKAADAKKASDTDKANTFYSEFKQGIKNTADKPVLIDWFAKFV